VVICLWCNIAFKS